MYTQTLPRNAGVVTCVLLQWMCAGDGAVMREEVVIVFWGVVVVIVSLGACVAWKGADGGHNQTQVYTETHTHLNTHTSKLVYILIIISSSFPTRGPHTESVITVTVLQPPFFMFNVVQQTRNEMMQINHIYPGLPKRPFRFAGVQTRIV